MSIYGELDGVNEALKRVYTQVAADWHGGEVRMRPEDIKRARKYLREIEKSKRGVLFMLKKFEAVELKTEQDKRGIIISLPK